ncbi:MAG: hypothetical protein ACYC4U_32805 [Pirellulaceae bacterium]
MVGGLLSAAGIAAVWALFFPDAGRDTLRYAAAMLCPAGAVAGAIAGAHAGLGISRTIMTATVAGGVTGGTIAATYACNMVITGKFHPMAIFVSLIFVPVIFLAATAWGGAFALTWCGCRSVFVRKVHLGINDKVEAAQSNSALRISMKFLLAAAVWNAVLFIWFAICLAHFQHRLAPLEELEAAGGKVSRIGDSSGSIIGLPAHFGDADLGRVVDSLNDVSDIFVCQRLDLSQSRVTGAGLAHLKRLSKQRYFLCLSAGQVDEVGLANLCSSAKLLIGIKVVGSVSEENQARIKAHLFQVESIEFGATIGSRS